jgi:AcrR family transcriptional regulator
MIVLVMYRMRVARAADHTRSARRPPGRPRRAATDDAITKATRALLAERGFQATTIEAIADRAAVGRNTIYRRWSSKEELIADSLRELTIDFDARPEGDLYSLLLEWLRDFARTFSDPLLGRLLATVLGELQRNPVFADVYADRVVRPRRSALVGRLTEARERGELRADVDVEHVADLLGGPLLLRLLPLGLPPLSETYVEDLLETVWRGISP